MFKNLEEVGLLVDKIEIKDTTDPLGKFLRHHTAVITINGVVVVARGVGENYEEAKKKAKESYKYHHNKEIPEL